METPQGLREHAGWHGSAVQVSDDFYLLTCEQNSGLGDAGTEVVMARAGCRPGQEALFRADASLGEMSRKVHGRRINSGAVRQVQPEWSGAE